MNNYEYFATLQKTNSTHLIKTSFNSEISTYKSYIVFTTAN